MVLAMGPDEHLSGLTSFAGNKTNWKDRA